MVHRQRVGLFVDFLKYFMVSCCVILLTYASRVRSNSSVETNAFVGINFSSNWLYHYEAVCRFVGFRFERQVKGIKAQLAVLPTEKQINKA